MLKQILKTIHKYKMFESGDRVVVAVSGGPDSICLLNILSDLNARLCLKLCVAHLDHDQRKNSSKDREFTRKAAKGLGLSFYSKILNVKLIKKGSLEDSLRRLRYDFLLDVAKNTEAKKIAMAHHKDDQAETVLMRLLRGTGMYGMSAILPVREIGGFTIVRPLLEVSRKDIMAYLNTKRITYRTDETNFEDRFFRNKIRNNLLPLLEKNYNPSAKEVLSSFALSIGADYEFLSRQAEEFIKKYLVLKKGVLSVPLVALKKLDIALRRIVLREMVAKLCNDLRGMTFGHGEELEDLLFSRPIFSEVHLPKGVVALKSKNDLILNKVWL